MQSLLGCSPKYSSLYNLNLTAINKLFRALDEHGAQLWDDNTFVVLMIDNLQQLFTKPMRKHRLYENDRVTPLKLASPVAAHVGQLVYDPSDLILELSKAQHDMDCAPRIIFGCENIRQKLIADLIWEQSKENTVQLQHDENLVIRTEEPHPAELEEPFQDFLQANAQSAPNRDHTSTTIQLDGQVAVVLETITSGELLNQDPDGSTEAEPDPNDKFPGVLLNLLSHSEEEAKVLKSALHEFIGFAFALRDGNGTCITTLLSHAETHSAGHVHSKRCLVCGGLNERLPGNVRFPIYCRLPECEGKQVSDNDLNTHYFSKKKQL